MALIRAASESDRDPVLNVYLRSFLDNERDLVSAVARTLLSAETRPETINLVAEVNGELAGHIAFSPVTFDSNHECTGYILAPLAVLPEHQRRGVGSALVRNGMDRLSQSAVDLLFVYGDPKYYGRFGFTVEAATRFGPPFDPQFSFGWQAVALHPIDIEANAKIICVDALNDPRLW